jgi:hypothetical protein
MDVHRAQNALTSSRISRRSAGANDPRSRTQINLTCTVSDLLELDPATAPNGGYRALTVTSDRDTALQNLEITSNLIWPNRRDVRIAYSAGRAGAEHPDLGCWGCGCRS